MVQIKTIFYYVLSSINLCYCQSRFFQKDKLSNFDTTTSVEAFCPYYSKKTIFAIGFPSRCGAKYSSCKSDSDCGIELKCCFDGCISTCELPTMRPVKRIKLRQKKHFVMDSKRTHGRWFVDESRRLLKRIPCTTTSAFAQHQSSKCPRGYVCKIEKKENERKNRAKKGYCIYNPKEGLMAHVPAFVAQNTDKGCTLKGMYYADGQHFVDSCKFCFCRNTVINCNLTLRCSSGGNRVD